MSPFDRLTVAASNLANAVEREHRPNEPHLSENVREALNLVRLTTPKKETPTMAASNTKDCVKELIGKRIIGVLFDALPLNDRKLAVGNKTLVFDDGTGFTFSNSGSFWQENATDIKRAIEQKKAELDDVKATYEAVLALAGAL